MEKNSFESRLNQISVLSLKMIFVFVKYRLHISLIFFFLLYYNNLRYGFPINYPLLISFSLWHFALFLFDRVYDRKIDKISQPDEYIEDKNSSSFYAVVVLLLAVSLIFYFITGFKLIYWLILFPITFLYPYRVVGRFRIKSLLFVKNLYSALLIFCLPLIIQLHLISNGDANYTKLLTPILSLFIYVLIGEVFWDIRDMQADKTDGTATIPNTLGLLATKIYIIILILADAFLTKNFFSTSAIVYLLLVIFVRESSYRLFFHLPPLIALIRFIV